MDAETGLNRRAADRIVMVPMYTAVTAQRNTQQGRQHLEGHAYDISANGVRIELDEPLAPGERVAMNIRLPGDLSDVAASGEVVWVHDSHDDPGPRRMALRFADFRSPHDRDRLTLYLRGRSERLAA
jgi:hypothetical protein